MVVGVFWRVFAGVCFFSLDGSGPLVDLSAAKRCELKWMEEECVVALSAAAERLTVTFLSPGLAVTTVLLGLGSLAMTAQCPCSPRR